jgi:hypothetical protein
MVSTSWVMLQTCGRILLGQQSSTRWRSTARSGSVSQLYARDIQNRSNSSLSLDNCRRLRLWVWTQTPLSPPFSHPNRWLPDPMRLQAFLRTYLPILGKDECFLHRSAFLILLATSSVMRTSTTTRVHCVTNTACVWPAYVGTPAFDFVMNPVGVASSLYLM